MGAHRVDHRLGTRCVLADEGVGLGFELLGEFTIAERARINVDVRTRCHESRSAQRRTAQHVGEE